MPWREVSVMEERREFVRLAMSEGVNRRELCRRFGNQRGCWLQMAGACQGWRRGTVRSVARPHDSPRRSCAAIEALVCPCGRSIRHGERADRGLAAGPGRGAAGDLDIHQIQRRHGLIEPFPAARGTSWTRFEREQPNTSCGRWTSRAGSACLAAALPSPDDRRRPLALLALPEGLRRSEAPNRPPRIWKRPSSAIWPAAGLLRRHNGPPWGEPGGEGWDAAWRVAAHSLA